MATRTAERSIHRLHAGVILTAVVVTLALPLTSTAAVLFEGPEFQVNTYTLASQIYTGVARHSAGSFIVVWRSDLQDGTSTSVHGQRFDSDGMRNGTEFQINAYTTGPQKRPAVALAADGSFVAVWESTFGGAGSENGIRGRRFDANGAPDGTEFQVNSYTTESQVFAAIAANGDGSFVVLWHSNQDGSSGSVQAQRFSADGAPNGTEFQVNTYTTGNQTNPAAAPNGDGSFVVVWTSTGGQDGSLWSVQGQRFDADGAPDGTEFQVNSYTTERQAGPDIASDASGAFVVVWGSNFPDGIQGQRFDSDGAPNGTEFQVNTYTTEQQHYPAVAMDAGGSFMVVWSQHGSASSVRGQHFDADGAPNGTEFRVNTYTTDRQENPSIAGDGQGNFTVIWHSFGQDGNAFGTFGQLLTDDPDNDGLGGSTDPCPNDPRNQCAGMVAVDGATGNEIRVNANVSSAECAGDKTDCNGDMWYADFGYNQAAKAATCSLGGGGESCVIAGIAALFGCEDETTEDLFQCEHADKNPSPELIYSFDVPDGVYIVNLLFGNTYDGTTEPGQRVFDILVEGMVEYASFDQVAAAGGSGIAVVRSAVVVVEDGNGLQIELVNGPLNNPAIKGIEVLAFDLSVTTTTTTTTTTVPEPTTTTTTTTTTSTTTLSGPTTTTTLSPTTTTTLPLPVNTCFPATGETTPHGPGSDGDVQAGLALSYTDNGDGTITDNNTGLMWEKKDDSGGIHDMDNA